ncbi:MAG: DUF2934 domain-containing protein [Magnetococcales bacterium]|nr:DUF2934 domain-containing protein [Magnetococcales bacterium]MBF0149998.1 DUF2934 domain-containing protein [Magnetococcales bacterium]MBF0174247.1 DUF2934 domain-containing protein [Magnetococcales bacterium]MBF0347775.1 DUF2934 domain-containing protein [Magnetococcales bacterium]MBF0631274.1 DUF2934 domain-containing protein [Magnetococcales bacterium]
MSVDNEEQIRLMAYSLWEREHRPHGRDLEFWYEAEQQLKVSGQIGRHDYSTDPVKVAHPEKKE